MKFFIALVLSLAVFSFANAQGIGTIIGGNYFPVKWDPDGSYVYLLNYGLQMSIPHAVAAGKLANGKWNWININGVQAQALDGMNYDFNVEIQDETGDTANFDVVVHEGTDGRTLSLLSWQVLSSS